MPPSPDINKIGWRILEIVISVCVIVVILVGIVWWFSRPTPPTSSNSSPSFGTVPSVYSTTVPVSSSPSGSGNGTSFSENFLSNTDVTKDPINSGLYYLGPHPYEGVSDPTATTSPPYVIEYDHNTQTFTIELLSEPVSQVRQEMEQQLTSDLGLTQQQMCALSYTVTVAYWVDPYYAGENLGFSFCPGAITNL